MLVEQPELLDLFSRSAQATGAQRRALAGAVAAFATSLAGQTGPHSVPIDVMIERIAHRHASLGIRPEQYTIVGKYLLHAVTLSPQGGPALDREDLRRIDALLIGRDYSDELLDALLPYVRQNPEVAAALRALPLGEVTNALVLVAGGRK